MTNNQSNELREILEEHHSIVTNDLGRRLIVALQAYVQDRERLARIDELQKLDDTHQTNTQDLEREHPGYCVACVPCTPIWERIKQLEQLKAGK